MGFERLSQMSCRISAHTANASGRGSAATTIEVRAAELGEELPGAKGAALALR